MTAAPVPTAAASSASAPPAAAGKTPGKKKEKKKGRVRNIVLGVGVVLAVFIWYGFQPLQGPITVGICRTFFGLQIAYPQTLQLVENEQFKDITRLFLTYTGPFGEFRSSMVECRFSADPATNMPLLTDVTIDNQLHAPQDVLDAFNKTIPIIISNRPDTTIPFPPEDTLEELKKD